MLATWALTLFGIVYSLGNSKLTYPYVDKLIESQNVILHFLGELLICPMCLGFWVAGLLSLLWYSPTDRLILDMFLGSGICWILYVMCYFLSRGEI